MIEENLSLQALLAAQYAIVGVGFWRLSRGSWVPVPLVYVYVGLSLGFAISAAMQEVSWMFLAAVGNRLFDAALLYLVACCAYRRTVRPDNHSLTTGEN